MKAAFTPCAYSCVLSNFRFCIWKISYWFLSCTRPFMSMYSAVFCDAQFTAEMQWVAECLPQTCRSFTNLIFLKLQEAKSVNTGTVVLQSLAGSQPWSRRQGLCCCLSVKGASEWLQHPESLIWEEGSGMWPQAWSPGEKAARGSETGHAWELWKTIPEAEYDHRNRQSDSLILHSFNLCSCAPKRGRPANQNTL